MHRRNGLSTKRIDKGSSKKIKGSVAGDHSKADLPRRNSSSTAARGDEQIDEFERTFAPGHES